MPKSKRNTRHGHRGGSIVPAFLDNPPAGLRYVPGRQNSRYRHVPITDDPGQVKVAWGEFVPFEGARYTYDTGRYYLADAYHELINPPSRNPIFYTATRDSVKVWGLNVERMRLAGALDAGLLDVRWTDAGDLNLVKELLNAGANPSAIHPENGWTPLMTACQEGHIEGAGLLITKGANVNYRIHGEKYSGESQDGLTALLVACNQRNIEMVRLLVARGADVNATMDGHVSVLHCAAIISPDLEIVKLLVESGADVDKEYPEMRSAFKMAMLFSKKGENNMAIAKYLSEKSPMYQAKVKEKKAQMEAQAQAQAQAAAVSGTGLRAIRQLRGPEPSAAPRASTSSAPRAAQSAAPRAAQSAASGSVPSASSAPRAAQSAASGPVPSASSAPRAAQSSAPGSALRAAHDLRGQPPAPRKSWRKGGKRRFYTRKYSK